MLEFAVQTGRRGGDNPPVDRVDTAGFKPRKP